ncbi:MAG: right-handed parallel beta-helix repeat-containing protein [Alphaproteobacteria bacterium]|nr:right-handed parallel beta-helix repeat-containing protein [Alphaproteobacteria bacterium]
MVNDDAAGNPNEPAPCNAAPDDSTINGGVGMAAAGDTVTVCPGVYVENVLIGADNLKLVSTGGFPLTILQGISDNSQLGTIEIDPDTDGVQIGEIGKGFTIVGIDNGFPGIENAAIYFQGSHAGARILGNKIVAAGEHGLLTEFGATISDFRIEGNEFAGQTFLGNAPDGCGFGDQFTQPNRPRQLVVMGGGAGGGNTSDVAFVDNRITGTAGGPSPTCGNAGEQGNTLVTIDAVDAKITGNHFAGTTARFGTALRARGPDTKIRKNTFSSAGLTPTACYIFLQEIGAKLKKVADRNAFDTDPLLLPDKNATTGSICVGSPDDDDDDDDDD